MKAQLAMTLAVALIPLQGALTPVAATEPCTGLVPGKSLGRYVLGTELKEPSTVEPDALPGWSRPKDPTGRAVRLRFDSKKALVEFEAPLPACLELPGRTLESPDPLALAAALGTCGPMSIQEGGNLIACSGLDIVSGAAGGKAPPSLRMHGRPAPAASCAVYASPQGWADAKASHPATKAFSLEPARTGPICIAGFPAPIRAQTRLVELERPGCKKEALRGGTHLTCGAVTFSFAGPDLALQSLSISPTP